LTARKKHLQNLDELLEGRLLNSCLHNLHHLLNNELLVGGLGVAGGLDLLLGSLGEGNTEKTQNESVGGLGLNVGLDQRVPLLDHGARLIAGDVHAVEVGVAVESLDLVDLEFHLSPGLGLALVVAVGQRDVEHTALEGLTRLLLSSGLVAGGEGDASLIESWGQDVVPLLSHERVSAKQHGVSTKKHGIGITRSVWPKQLSMHRRGKEHRKGLLTASS